MKRKAVVCLLMAGFSVGLFAADQSAAQPMTAQGAVTQPTSAQAAPATGQTANSPDSAKQILAQNFQVLQNEQARVLVLQDLLTREASQLRQLEEQFCKMYKLDVNKWRQGLYRYDVQADKFVEVAPQKPAKKKK